MTAPSTTEAQRRGSPPSRQPSHSRWARLALLATFTLAATLARLAGALEVGYPSTPLVQCGGPAQLEWSGQQGQVFVSVVDNNNAVVADLGQQPAHTNSITWYPIKAPAGMQVRVAVRDQSGATAMSPMLNVQGSNDRTCIAAVASNPLPSFTLITPTTTETGPAAPTTTSAGQSTSSDSDGQASAAPVSSTTSSSSAPSGTNTSTTPAASTPASSTPAHGGSNPAPNSAGRLVALDVLRFVTILILTTLCASSSVL